MVQSNYTVSTVQQLLGSMPPVRVSGSKSKSTNSSTADKLSKLTDKNNIIPAPTRPLPPIPSQELRMRASRSSEVLPFSDRLKLRSETDVPAAVDEDEVLVLPATVYTPTTAERATESTNPTSAQPTDSLFVPLIETPRKGKKPATVEKRISQYYEYITPPISLGLGRTSSRRDRKASHTPTSSEGSDIYFSPIDANMSQVFLSSPQPSPPISPSDILNGHDLKDGRVGEVVKGVATLVVDTTPVKQPDMVEIAGIGRLLDNRKMTLPLAHVDRVTTALALAPLLQKSMRGSYFDETTTKVPDESAETSSASKFKLTDLPTPPPSEGSTTETSASIAEEFGGIALIDTSIEGAPVSLASTEAFDTGRCTHLSLPYGLSASSSLRVEPPTSAGEESRIILQSLFITLDCKTSERALTLVAETDVTTSFARAALTELAHAQNLTLDDLEIQTPTTRTTYSPDDESIDWCRLGEEQGSLPVSSPMTDILDESIATLAALSAETCTMQTLTLVSELARLQKAHSTFLILQPTRYDAQGDLAGVKIPLISEALRKRFVLMAKAGSSESGGPSSPDSFVSTASISSHGDLRGRQFREAVIATVAPEFAREEEFERFVLLEDGKVKVRARCVPLSDGRKIEKWVCFLGGEYDVPY